MIMVSDGSETEREVRQILDLVLEQEMLVNINVLWGCTVPRYKVTIHLLIARLTSNPESMMRR